MLYELISSRKASVDPRKFRGGINPSASHGFPRVEEGDPHPGMTLQTDTGTVHITPERIKPCVNSLKPLKDEGIIQNYRYIEQEDETLLVVEF